jgi:hypothetical protein
MAEKVLRYYKDHGASLAEAESIAKCYLRTSDQARNVNNQEDLRGLIKSVEELKQQVSRFKHDGHKYRWSVGLEKNVLDKLKQIKL